MGADSNDRGTGLGKDIDTSLSKYPSKDLGSDRGSDLSRENKAPWSHTATPEFEPTPSDQDPDELTDKEPTTAAGGPREESGDGTYAEDQVLHGIPLLLCTVSLLLCMFLVALDQTIVATLLESVGNQFNDFGKISWVATGYLLPTAVLCMNWGKMSIIFGRKYAMLVAVVLFEAGSLMCALSQNMNTLIGGRVLAGVGGGGIQVLVFVILTEITTIDRRGIAQGLVGAAFGMASVVGPLVGGAFTTHVTWRWCFYINLPIGGVAFACIYFLFNPPFPRGSLVEKLKRVDYLGTFLLTAGLVLVLLALTFGSTNQPWSSPVVIAFFVVGFSLLLAYFAYNFTICANPMMPLWICREIYVLTPVFGLMFVFGGFMATVLYLATYFQVVQNQDALHSGISLLPTIVSLVIVSIISGIVVSKTRMTKPFAIAGTALMAIGLGLVSTFGSHLPTGKHIGYMILCGVGIGLTFQTTMLSAQVASPKKNGGVILTTSLVGFGRAIGGVLGSTLGQTIQSVVFKGRVKSLDLPPNVDVTLLLNSPETIHTLPPALEAQVIDAFVAGFRRVIYFSLAFAVAGFVCTCFYTNELIPKPVAKPVADTERPEPEPEVEGAKQE